MQDRPMSSGRAALPTVSHRPPSGELVELVYDRDDRRTQFAVGTETDVVLVDEYKLPDGTTLVPYSARNNLIRHEVVLLPSRPEPSGSESELFGDIDAYLRKYVDLDDDVRLLAAYYVLFTWVYDAFNELPYLRFRGDYGSGKTRALFVIGSLCNKAFFASGASTVSPIFHTLDTFRGTLLFDEADFRFTDEKAELVKILNNGNVRGFPVLRTTVTQKKEFEPRAFMVYGPKLVAMRRSYEDEALESRFFTAEMGPRRLRGDIPINLPDSQRAEALTLRNRLLGYRFDTLGAQCVDPQHVDSTLSPRLNQVLVPLLSIVNDDGARAQIRVAVLGMRQTAMTGEHELVERRLVRVLARTFDDDVASVSVGKITAQLIAACGREVRRPLTARYVGEVLRERLGVMTYKSHGVFVVPASEKKRIEDVARRLGLPIDEDTETPV